MIRGIILDIDGTLVDSNQAHAEAFSRSFREQGYEIPAKRVWPFIGMGGKLLVSKLIGEDEDSPVVKKISEGHGRIFKEGYLHSLAPFPKTRDLVLKLQTANRRVCVGTSAKSDEVASLLRIAEVEDLIDLRVSATDVDCPKPHPDIVIAALKKMELKPEQALMLGDTPYDIEASRRAGVQCVGLLCGGWEAGDLQGALAIYRDPADLLDQFESSPFSLY